MNRGAGHRDVFRTVGDGRHFLRLVGEGCALTGVEVHAFCLMGNRYHLLVHCPDAGLSAFMHRLGSMYTRYVNERLQSDGPIFRGRYHALLVDTVAYRVLAARYIHRNPVDRRPPVALDRYPWSSYGSYIGVRPAPEWLSTAHLLGVHDGATGMRRFVEGEQSRGVASVEWSIDTALCEHGDDLLGSTPHVRRAIAVAMLDLATADETRRIVDRWLAFQSGDARRTAIARSRRRRAREPALDPIARRALTLLAASG